MANHKVRPISPVKSVRDETFRTLPPAAGQTFKKGAFVRVQGGTLLESGADPADGNVAGVSTAGVGDYDWNYDSFGNEEFHLPLAAAEQQFRGTLGGANTNTTPVASPDVSAEVGAVYGITVDAATGFYVIDRAETINTVVRIIDVDDEAKDGDTNIPVSFIILPAKRQVIL